MPDVLMWSATDVLAGCPLSSVIVKYLERQAWLAILRPGGELRRLRQFGNLWHTAVIEHRRRFTQSIRYPLQRTDGMEWHHPCAAAANRHARICIRPDNQDVPDARLVQRQ
jgi:hypothetical protein